jgi:hypothetical protein
MNHMNKIAGRLIFMAAAVLSGCAHFTATQPQPPITVLPVVPNSALNVTITAPVSLVGTAAESALPPSFDVPEYNFNINGGADHCDSSGISFGYHVERTPIAVTGSGATLSATTDLHYRIGARARTKVLFVCSPLIYANCGKDSEWPRVMTLTLAGTFTGVDAGWNPELSFSSALNPQNTCNVTLLNIDVTPTMRDAVKVAIDRVTPQLHDQLLSQVGVPAKVSTSWKTLEDPIAVGDSAWLMIHPQGIGVSPFTVNDGTMLMGISLIARPELILAKAAPSSDSTPLPGPTAIVPGNSFNMAVPIEATYDYVNDQLRKALKVGTMDGRFPATGNEYITVNDVSVYVYGAQIVIRLDIKIAGWFGDSATVYLVGTPAFDSGASVLSFPDAEFTVESQSILVKLAAWLNGSALRDNLRADARIDLSTQISTARAALQKAINGKVGPLTLTGNVARFTILGMYPSAVDAKNESALSDGRQRVCCLNSMT